MASVKGPQINLPIPQQKGTVSVEEAIGRRCSTRCYRQKPLTLAQLSQLLWVAQGITTGHRRAAPSAGATYPLEAFAFVASSGVEGLVAGVYHYQPETHSLVVHAPGDLTGRLSHAALDQRAIAEAPVSMLVAAILERTSRRYGRRAERYVAMEAGHVGQNVHLQAAAMGLGTVMIGAFDDAEVGNVLGTGKELEPLYIMPVGMPT